MGYQPQPYVPRQGPPQLTSRGRSRPPSGTKVGQNALNLLDSWSPKLDHGHHERVQLYRKRKAAIFRHEREHQRRRECPPTTDLATPRDVSPSVAESYAPSDDSTMLLSSTSTILPSNYKMPGSSLTFSDLGSTFQDELDTYNAQIKALQEGEWPTLPDARAPMLRVNHSEPSGNESSGKISAGKNPYGKEFHRRAMQALKSWSVAQGILYGGSTASLRDTDRVYDETEYQVGVIFSAPYHTSSTTDERWVSVADIHNTATPYGIIHSKYRKLVVVKRFGEHCLCVPIYSNNGRGLEGKKFLHEWVSIRDVSDKKAEKPEGPNVRLLAVANPGFSGKVVHGKSNIKLSESYCHRFDLPATMEGRLENYWSLSTRRLVELVRAFR
ncbi:hypothetical protein F4861DRAFT_317411 [Xylaria intraflava]|nr:hypothetical protein F4861DRAFT_317411 [Xylaria intraflava]